MFTLMVPSSQTGRVLDAKIIFSTPGTIYISQKFKMQDWGPLLTISEYFMGIEKNSVLLAICKKTVLVLFLLLTTLYSLRNKVDGAGQNS